MIDCRVPQVLNLVSEVIFFPSHCLQVVASAVFSLAVKVWMRLARSKFWRAGCLQPGGVLASSGWPPGWAEQTGCCCQRSRFHLPDSWVCDNVPPLCPYEGLPSLSLHWCPALHRVRQNHSSLHLCYVVVISTEGGKFLSSCLVPALAKQLGNSVLPLYCSLTKGRQPSVP